MSNYCTVGDLIDFLENFPKNQKCLIATGSGFVQNFDMRKGFSEQIVLNTDFYNKRIASIHNEKCLIYNET